MESYKRELGYIKDMRKDLIEKNKKLQASLEKSQKAQKTFHDWPLKTKYFGKLMGSLTNQSITGFMLLLCGVVGLASAIEAFALMHFTTYGIFTAAIAGLTLPTGTSWLIGEIANKISKSKTKKIERNNTTLEILADRENKIHEVINAVEKLKALNEQIRETNQKLANQAKQENKEVVSSKKQKTKATEEKAEEETEKSK